MLVPSVGFAQSNTADPMSYIKSLQNDDVAPSEIVSRSRGINITNTDEDLYTYTYGADKVAVDHIASVLERTYGAPKTGRGDLRIWEVRNPNRKTRHAKHVTIMLGPNSHGEQELTIDQRGAGRSKYRPKPQKNLKLQRKNTRQVQPRSVAGSKLSANVQPDELVD